MPMEGDDVVDDDNDTPTTTEKKYKKAKIGKSLVWIKLKIKLEQVKKKKVLIWLLFLFFLFAGMCDIGIFGMQQVRGSKCGAQLIIFLFCCAFDWWANLIEPLRSWFGKIILLFGLIALNLCGNREMLRVCEFSANS